MGAIVTFNVASRNKVGWLAILVAILAGGALAQPERGQVGAIDFFGYKGIDVESVRAALPVHEGDAWPFTATQPSEEWREAVWGAVRKAIGHDPTDVSVVCCDEGLKYLIYIGLGGGSSKRVRYNPTPKGAARFSPEVVKLYEAKGRALMAAVRSGNAREDDSQGFALADDPAVRAIQIAIRDYTLNNEPDIFRVLDSSSDREQRAIAADVLGYARASSRQVASLARASLDPDELVRNNAVRALGVLVRAKPEFARDIPISRLLQLLASPTWTDHNKGAALFEALTRSRDRRLLGQLRTAAFDNLLEMTRWRSAGHAGFARMVLGRIAGIEEDRLNQLVKSGDVDAIVDALPTGRR